MSDPVGIVCLVLCEVAEWAAVLIEVTLGQRGYNETNSTYRCHMQKEDILILVVWLRRGDMFFRQKHTSCQKVYTVLQWKMLGLKRPIDSWNTKG